MIGATPASLPQCPGGPESNPHPPHPTGDTPVPLVQSQPSPGLPPIPRLAQAPEMGPSALPAEQGTLPRGWWPQEGGHYRGQLWGGKELLELLELLLLLLQEVSLLLG